MIIVVFLKENMFYAWLNCLGNSPRNVIAESNSVIERF